MAADSTDLWIQKYKELYDLAKESFAEELARLQRLDSKASNYLSTLTILIGIYGYFVQYALDKCYPAKCWHETVLLISLALLGILLVLTWYVVFRVIKMQSYHKISVEPEFYKNNELGSIYYSMATDMKVNMLKNREIDDKKALRLTVGYWLIMFDAFFIIVSAVIYVWHLCSIAPAK
jgi:hypothetical protein